MPSRCGQGQLYLLTDFMQKVSVLKSLRCVPHITLQNCVYLLQLPNTLFEFPPKQLLFTYSHLKLFTVLHSFTRISP